MDDLVQFLRDRLDEDESIAREAAHYEAGHWTTQDGYPVSVADELPEAADIFERVVVFGEGSPSEEQAAHIARHDPARILAEVKVDRKMLAEYEQLLKAYERHKKEAAALSADVELAERTGRWEGWGNRRTREDALRREEDYLPAMLHVIERWAKGKAAVYDSHPRYNEAWRP